MNKKCFRAHVFFYKRINIFVVVKVQQVNHEKNLQKENYMINYIHTIYRMKINTILSAMYIL